MKKLILISLVIFFAICSRSWAGEIDGKGVICGEDVFYFDDGKVYKISMSLNNYKITKREISDEYRATIDAITFWWYTKFKLNRQNLNLYKIEHKEVHYDTDPVTGERPLPKLIDIDIFISSCDLAKSYKDIKIYFKAKKEQIKKEVEIKNKI